MKAIILAGGKGTRLRPLTIYTPKPVVPFLNQPFLLYQLKILERAGIRDITLSLSYQPDKIEQVLGDGSEYNVNLTFVTEPSPLGTGGAYKFAADSIAETTLVLNGDILTDVDISKIVKFHAEKKAEATIVLTPVENPSRYGLVETEPDGKILRFLEKPKPEEAASLTANNINAGIYILEPSVLDLIPKGENRSFEYNVFPDLLEKNRPFFAYILEKNYWRDIGNPDSYLTAHLDFLSGKIKGFAVESKRDDSDISHKATVDKKSVIGGDCVIKPGARIANSVIGAGVHVEEKSVIENSVIWSHTRISGGARIENSVLGRSCFIGKNAVVGGAILGDKTSLTDYTRV